MKQYIVFTIGSILILSVTSQPLIEKNINSKGFRLLKRIRKNNDFNEACEKRIRHDLKICDSAQEKEKAITENYVSFEDHEQNVKKTNDDCILKAFEE